MYQNHLKSHWSTPYCCSVSVSQCGKVSWINIHALHVGRIFGELCSTQSKLKWNTLNQVQVDLFPLWEHMIQHDLCLLFSHFNFAVQLTHRSLIYCLSYWTQKDHASHDEGYLSNLTLKKAILVDDLATELPRLLIPGLVCLNVQALVVTVHCPSIQLILCWGRGGWILSQLTLSKRQGTPWTGCMSMTGLIYWEAHMHSEVLVAWWCTSTLYIVHLHQNIHRVLFHANTLLQLALYEEAFYIVIIPWLFPYSLRMQWPKRLERHVLSQVFVIGH